MTSKKPNDMDKDSEAYRRLRERNNQAVKKSRTKSRMKAKQTQERVARLRQEREDLLRTLDDLRSKLAAYKEMFIHQVGAIDGSERLKQLDLSFLHDDDSVENHC